MSAETVLGPAIVEAVRELVRQELSRAAAPSALTPPGASSPWMTPPQAARATGVPLKRITDLRAELAREGGLRLRNRDHQNVKQRKYLVHVDVLRKLDAQDVLTAPSPSIATPPVDLAEAASRIRAKRAGR